MRANRNLLGILCIVFGVMMFSVQDAILKFISDDYALSMAMAARCAVSLPLLVIMVHFDCGLAKLLSPRFAALAIRGCILLVAYTTYYMALPALPLAEAIALFFAAPIIVTILSVPFLGERVSPQSWAAVALGFVGVLIILQPGTGLFNAAALFSLVSAFAYAAAMVFARKLGVSEPATVMAFYQNAIYLVFSLGGAALLAYLEIEHSANPSLNFLVRPWEWPRPFDLALMGGCGVIAAVAMSLLTQGYRIGESNLVTVFEYTGMIWAPVWGFVFFSEVPRATTLLGLGLILAAGILSVRSATKEPSQSRPAPSTS